MTALSAYFKNREHVAYLPSSPAVNLCSIAVRRHDVIHGLANVRVIVRNSGDLQQTLPRQILGAHTFYFGRLRTSNTRSDKC